MPVYNSNLNLPVLSKPLAGWALTLAIAAMVTGCGSGNNRAYDDDYYGGSNHRLEINDFWVIDTQNRDSRSTANMEIDYRTGEFNIQWDADFRNGYNARLYVSKTPLAQDGYEIAATYCGTSQNCGYTGAFYCDYGSDYTVICDNHSKVDLFNLISPAPRKLYLVLQLCDTASSRCDSDAEEVTFY